MEIELKQVLKQSPQKVGHWLTQSITQPVPWVAVGTAVGISAFSLAACNPSNLVAQGIERELPNYVGPADHYDVEIIGLDLKSDSAQSVLAVGERVRPEGAPVIERLTLELEDVSYSRATERLTQVGSAHLTAIIKTPDLEDFLEEYRSVRSAAITLRAPDFATISVRPQLGDFSLPAGITVNVTGQIVGQGARVNFEVTDVSAAGINVSSLAARGLSNAINPLADLGNLPVDIDITAINVAGDTLGVDVIGDPSSFRL